MLHVFQIKSKETKLTLIHFMPQPLSLPTENTKKPLEGDQRHEIPVLRVSTVFYVLFFTQNQAICLGWSVFLVYYLSS